MSEERIAENFMLHAIQEWGDEPETRIAAVQLLLNAAGFSATATCWPIFGGIWQKPCEGPDGEAATEWLQSLTKNLKRGEYNSEVRQIREAVNARFPKRRV